MKADKQFPVSTGTVLSLRCNEGHELRGDTVVTCLKNREFHFSVEPSCGENITTAITNHVNSYTISSASFTIV